MKVLITGLNNYLARNVATCLASADHQVTCLVRSRKFFHKHVQEREGLHIIEGDLFRRELPLGIDSETQVAFYFNQSPINELDIRLEMESIALQKYIQALQATACQHLIYVTKLTDDNLEKIESYIRQSGFGYTIVRVSNIIGKGSSLVNILSTLAKQQLVILPKEFATSRCQPVHLLDVCSYFSSMMLDENTYGKTFDIGGPEVMTYREAFERYLAIIRLKKTVLALPGLGVSLSVFFSRYVYQFEQDVAAAFIAYMRHDLVATNNGLKGLYPIKLTPFGVAIRYALERVTVESGVDR
ncbi:Uncharacterized conserved protein YbjT, contains NAD(P)-binding and DUF2867 domains [Parapedobacter composti]|uniref:Uncharacterized conserved protein YbjT, contains NAD(P)-binding and DUF2867 domains n=1 Tax=Parapedobacter composti TaxID=623281 RepID=A0A1I1JIW9_9SPHI|nr:hypothetical protein [Parapedobacter composti]SFC48559.1 Uncharacterized conserved protein YbjT, contains NAD(P)-binding and DUF2867 domains [Parapedobacter composti]